MLQKLSHPSIIKYLGENSRANLVKCSSYDDDSCSEFEEKPDSLLLCPLELCEGGSLQEYINKTSEVSEASTEGTGRSIPDEDASGIMKSILEAVKYLHDLEIVHRDLKPENIMFKAKNSQDKEIRLIDFGLSTHHEETYFETPLEVHCGTMPYMAPEMINKQGYSKSVDIWALGIIMYNLISGGKHPLHQKGETTTEYKEKLKSKQKLTFDASFSDLAKDLIKKMCAYSPVYRYNIEQALKHPWITRSQETKPPLTYLEIIKYGDCQERLKNAIMNCFSLSVIQHRILSDQEPSKSPFKNKVIKSQLKLGSKQSKGSMEDYKELINKFSNKIEKWHKSLIEKQQGKFNRDEDFIDLQPSPTKFQSDLSSSSGNFSISKDSTNARSPKTGGFGASMMGNSKRNIRISNKKSKNALKGRFKRSPTYFTVSKCQSPDIKSRKSFKKFLKRSPDEKHSFRLNKKQLAQCFDSDFFIKLKPTEKEGLSSTETQDEDLTPILIKKNNVIQAQEPEAPISKSKKNNYMKQKVVFQNHFNSKYGNDEELSPDFAHKSLSANRSRGLSSNVPHQEHLNSHVKMKRLDSFRAEEQRSHLRPARRTMVCGKSENKNGNFCVPIGNFSDVEQDSGMNLPEITKTRSNYSLNSSSIDKIRVNSHRKRRSKVTMEVDQPYFEKPLKKQMLNRKSLNKKLDFRNENVSFIIRDPEGFPDCQDPNYSTVSNSLIRKNTRNYSNARRRPERSNRRMPSKYSSGSIAPFLAKNNMSITLVKRRTTGNQL
ncbi:unnamed protein product [Moneuplotes crassus]|uniref:Protein kinase domain-containing protein n=1 Tax=Euplotes crassus TaxID=5936 RepID=A0AAD1Y2Y7_EUPCR|nr:unnamed protein product [Moneuplotes crassus]